MCTRLVGQSEAGILLCKGCEAHIGFVCIRLLGQNHTVIEYGRECLRIADLKAKSHAHACGCRTENGANAACGNRLCALIFITRVKADLLNLLANGLTAWKGDLYRILGFKATACDLDISKSFALRIAGDLIHLRAKEGVGILLFKSVFINSEKQFLNPLHLQRRAKEAGENSPLCNRTADALALKRICGKELLHKSFVGGGTRLVKLGRGIGRKINASARKCAFKLIKDLCATAVRNIKLVYENKGGYASRREKMPKGFGMGGNTVGCADQKDSVILHRKGALRLAGEVNMTGGVDKGDKGITELKHRLF